MPNLRSGRGLPTIGLKVCQIFMNFVRLASDFGALAFISSLAAGRVKSVQCFK